MKRRAPKVRGVRVMRVVYIDGTFATKPADDPPLYWNESRRDWMREDGTHYKSIDAARAAIKRFKIVDGSVIT
jgi:hypothetical protein